MKKIIVSLVVLSIAISAVIYASKQTTPQLGASYESNRMELVGSKTDADVITYAHFATTTATTTVTRVLGENNDISDLNICMVASSTSSVLNWTYEFSLDGVNWYGQDSSSISGSYITHNSATTTHTFTAPTTTQVCRNFTIDNLNTDQIRFTFWRNDGSSAATNFNLYAEANVNYRK